MEVKLYVIPASHPCACVEAALEREGIGYDRVDLPPLVHAAHQRLRFGVRTVPVAVIDGERVAGSRRILRALGTPPGDEEAERWGDEVFQVVARKVLWPVFRRRPDALVSYTDGANLPAPRWMTRATAPVVAALGARYNAAGEDTLRAELALLPGHLDRIDRWIAEGVLGGETGADLQIGATLALLLTIEDLRPMIAPRPAGELASRLFPRYPGHVPAGTIAA